MIVLPLNPLDEISALLGEHGTKDRDRDLLERTLLDQGRQEYAPHSKMRAIDDSARCGECPHHLSILVTNDLDLVACGIKPWMVYWTCLDNSPPSHTPIIICPRCLMSGRRCSSCPTMASYISKDWTSILSIINRSARRQQASETIKEESVGYPYIH